MVRNELLDLLAEYLLEIKNNVGKIKDKRVQAAVAQMADDLLSLCAKNADRLVMPIFMGLLHLRGVVAEATFGPDSPESARSSAILWDVAEQLRRWPIK